MIILSRTDNIGDVVLTLPLATLLKKAFPNETIALLGQRYVADIANASPDIDCFLDWTALSTQGDASVLDVLKPAHTIVHVFPQARIARLAKKAGIKKRIGTNRRLFHWHTCNRLINLTRKGTLRHEAQHNCQFLRAFNQPTEYTLSELSRLGRLQPPASTLSLLTPNKQHLIIHPGSNGHTIEWPEAHFIELIKQIDQQKTQVILTGSKAEAIRFSALINACPEATNAMGQLNLAELISLIASSDTLIANSTGPLHVAAACNIKTLGLFPPYHNISPQRWQPLGPNATYLAAPITQPREACMASIRPATVLAGLTL